MPYAIRYVGNGLVPDGTKPLPELMSINILDRNDYSEKKGL